MKPKYLTECDGYRHFARRVPIDFVGFDKRGGRHGLVSAISKYESYAAFETSRSL
jgi:hypothetical protein